MWLGWKDLNPRMWEPESHALPLGDTPISSAKEFMELTTSRLHFKLLAGVAGFEPTNARVKVSCLTAWRHPNIYRGFLTASRLRLCRLKKLERVMGIEPTRSAWKAEILPLNYTRKSSLRFMPNSSFRQSTLRFYHIKYQLSIKFVKIL